MSRAEGDKQQHTSCPGHVLPSPSVCREVPRRQAPSDCRCVADLHRGQPPALPRSRAQSSISMSASPTAPLRQALRKRTPWTMALTLRTKTTRLAARGGRLHCPRDPRAGRRDADVAGRATASVGHRTAASRGETSGRTAPSHAVPLHDRCHHGGVAVPAMPMPHDLDRQGQPSRAIAFARSACRTDACQPRNAAAVQR
jgi:hypothetical protein